MKRCDMGKCFDGNLCRVKRISISLVVPLVKLAMSISNVVIWNRNDLFFHVACTHTHTHTHTYILIDNESNYLINGKLIWLGTAGKSGECEKIYIYEANNFNHVSYFSSIKLYDMIKRTPTKKNEQTKQAI